MNRPIGDPPGCHRIVAEPDREPVAFDLPQCLYAAWLTPQLMAETVADAATRTDHP